jgi:predicted CXXCH cytochrome family protein
MVALLFGCTPTTRYEVLSTIFDGVPSLPPPEQFCATYIKEAEIKKQNEAENTGKSSREKVTHPPYEEKKCDNCHDKSTDSGFVVKSKNELCFVCHKDFLKGHFVHGPAATGDCLFCHDPHSSLNPSLLKVPLTDVCDKCHREKRQSASMHNTVKMRGIVCVNCHDPHSENVRFFLR